MVSHGNRGSSGKHNILVFDSKFFHLLLRTWASSQVSLKETCRWFWRFRISLVGPSGLKDWNWLKIKWGRWGWHGHLRQAVAIEAIGNWVNGDACGALNPLESHRVKWPTFLNISRCFNWMSHCFRQTLWDSEFKPSFSILLIWISPTL